MRDEFREAYSRLLENRSAQSRRDLGTFRRAPESDKFLTAVRQRVQRGIGNADVTYGIRPDTKYALIVCFEELIALPFFQGLSRGLTGKQRERFLLSIENDTALVLQNAQAGKERLSNQVDEELTAGDIMRTISDVYDDLQTVDANIWG